MPEESYCKTDNFQSVELATSCAKKNDDEDEDEMIGEFPEIDHLSLYIFNIYFFLSIPMLLSGGFGMSWVFSTGIVNYRCAVPECEDPSNTTIHPNWLPNAVPYKNGEPATCTRFVVENSTDSCSTTIFTKKIQSCNTWVYDSEDITILNEWDLTCENNLWKLTVPGVLNNIGQIVGLIITSHFPDKYGRRNVVVILTLLSTILGIIRAFSSNYETFVASEFADAVMSAGIYGAGFVLGMEFVGPKKRVLMSNIIGCMHSFGEVVVSLYAMLFRSWRYFILAFYAPGLLIIFLPCFVPESVRWLRTKNRLEDAEAVLRKIAAKNGVEISEKSIQIIRKPPKKIQHNKSQGEEKSSSVSLARQTLTNTTILIRLLFCTICWLANSFIYYGLSLQSVELPGNKYINFMLVSLIEMPAGFASWFLMDYVGRKPTLSGSFLLTGVFCFVTLFVPTELWFMPLILIMSGKFCISLAFNVIYVFTIEIFPTPIRNLMFGICNIVGRFGSVVAPLMPLLANYMPSLPQLMYGVIAILSGILSLSFPETLGKELPDTIHQAVNIGKSEKEESAKIPTIKLNPFS